MDEDRKDPLPSGRGEVGTDIVERLKAQAKSASDAARLMAEAKSARNQAAGDVGAEYMWPKPEQTLEWRAAEEIVTLRSLLLNEQRCHAQTRERVISFGQGERP